MKTETWNIEKLTPYARNPRKNDGAVDKVAASLKEFGWRQPIVVDADGVIIAGHTRYKAARKLGMDKVPVHIADGLTPAQIKAYRIADNKVGELAEWDMELLALEVEDLKLEDYPIDLTGFDLGELTSISGEGTTSGEQQNKTLAERFGVPPFSVLNAREGVWQERKRQWLGLGMQSEVGRDIEPTNVSANLPDGHYMAGRGNNEGGSIFDPVLCELAYSWFSPPGGTILDPFAGGSVRGIVASHMGRQYVGVELRSEQIEANRAQAHIARDPQPVWHCGDSRNIDSICHDIRADFVFSCPPYADLEVYSDDPLDLSTLQYEDFRPAYFDIVKKACQLLKQDRFACFVVGDVRDKKGNYYNFVGDTVEAFRAAGLSYYNEAILITCVGSLPIRAGRQFASGRKLGKTHQNVLVFVKGDGKKAAKNCGEILVDNDMLDAYKLRHETKNGHNS
jgi:hypothetical protein